MSKAPEYGIDDFWRLVDSIEDKARRRQLRSLFEFYDCHNALRSAPASCHYHNSFASGWIDHSVRVCVNALRIREAIAPDLSRDSTVVAALCHDLTKLGFPVEGGVISRYRANPSFDPNRHVSRYNRPFAYNPHQPPFPLGVSSGIVAAKFLDLTWGEILAITASDGQWELGNRYYSLKENALLAVTMYADHFSGIIVEGDQPMNLWNEPCDKLVAGAGEVSP